MELVVEFDFCAAHRLPRHPGRCFRMHGHSYRLEVLVAGTPEADSGMVVDFFDVEGACSPVIESVRDTCLNEVLENPTAEAIVAWLWTRIQPRLPQLSELRLYETAACYVIYRGETVPPELLTPGSPGPHPSTAPNV
ncbi:MAG: 6-carboxytetrahydropterin synthase [Myxococcota bacterium]|nr:6-carboxytetrahydropterin synthase [Myxococcota bacterium]